MPRRFLVLIGLVLSLPAAAAAVARRSMPAPNEKLVGGNAVYDKHRLTDDVPAEESDDPFTVLENRILTPLTYPNRTHDETSRVRAYEELLAMRRAPRGRTHRPDSPG